MANQEEFPLKSAQDVVDYIANWKKQGGALRIDAHLKVDRAFRNVSTRDCDYVLTTATARCVQWPPEYDQKHQNYVLHIQSTDLDEEAVEMLFRIDFQNFTIIVFNWLA